MTDDTTFETPLDEFLAHYGIKGMHWGIRKDRSTVKVARKAKPKSKFKPGTTKDHKNAHSLERKPLNTLTNKQLKTLNTRIDLEKKYVELRNQRNVVNKGQNHIKQVISLASTATAAAGLGAGAYKFVKSPKGQALIKKGAVWLAKA